MTRYVVIENTPGYLPEDDDPFTTDDLDAARGYLRELVERHTEWCDETDQTYDVWVSEDSMRAEVWNRSGYSHDLGRSFSVDFITEDDSGE